MFVGLYKLLITLLFPLVRMTYIRKRIRIGKEHPTRFKERLGKYTYPRPEGKLYWMHGASVGEAISMLPLINKILAEDTSAHVMVTTGTVTSAEIMAKRLPERAFHQFIPFDVPAYAKRLLKHFKPDAVMWFESELWPSLLSEINKAKVPLILVNGRVSDDSYQTWSRFRFVSKEILGCFTYCLGQSEQDKNRLLLLGAKRASCVGNLKYAGLDLPYDEAKLAELKVVVGERPVFLISSTHHNEEAQLAAGFYDLKRAVPNVLIIVVPRHPHRGIEVATMFANKGEAVKLRSKGENLTADTSVYVADTIGEMGLWYKLAQVTFVGGSLIPHGGQNFIEPARDKNAVIVGPNMQNFTEMLSRAKVAHAVWQVNNAAEVIEQVIDLFRDKAELETRQRQAYQWTVQETAVLDGIVAALKRILHQ
jgi:3-deoxy-D-manno-octulosonic-acid transferase